MYLIMWSVTPSNLCSSCGRSRRPICASCVVGHAVQRVALLCGRLRRPTNAYTMWSVMPSITCSFYIYIYIYIYFTHVPHLKLNLGGGSLRERLSSATPLALNLKMDISGILTWSVKYQPVCHASSFEHSTLIPRHETYNVN